MEILSCPEVQYVGESSCSKKSPGSKSSDKSLEEKSSLMQVDFPQQKSGNELGTFESKQIILKVDCTQQIPEVNQSKGYNGGDEGILELRMLQRPNDELLNDINIAENTLQKVNSSQQQQDGQLLSNYHEGNASSLRADSLKLEECNIPNGSCELDNLVEAGEICKEKTDQFRSIEWHSCSDFLDGAENEKEVLNRLHKVSDYVLSTEETPGDERNVDKSKIYVTGPSVSQHNGEGSCTNLLGPSNHTSNIDYLVTGNLSFHKQNSGPSSSSKISSPFIQDQEGELQHINREGECGHMEAELLKQDGPEALWVKWRGKWQTGIRCSRADCPLPTLRAKPTHERKKYFVVFFPHTRTYSWADMLLVCSIDDLPGTLAYGTHYSWMALVKDLTIPRRYIMHKLAISMLNMSDRLHTDAVIESARKASSWKEFAREASCCIGYPDLGRMLLKLHRMILPDYIDPDWLEHSFGSWVQLCQNAQSAESVELLIEELINSVLWNDVQELWDAPVQPELGSEWRTWKQEAMKWFFTSHSVASGGDVDKQIYENSVDMGVHISRKRPKLEIRRPDICANETEAVGLVQSQVNRVKNDSRYFHCQGQINPTAIGEPSKVGVNTIGVPADSEKVANKFVEVVAEGVNLMNAHTSEVGTSADGRSGRINVVSAHHDTDSLKKYRQCLAFIEAKGRQCGRWANDGDIYCCVHLSLRSVSKPYRAEQIPVLKSSMCEGTTTHGKNCKHRARSGSAFCKKHQPHNNDMMDAEMLSSSSSKLKRKHGEDENLENIFNSNTTGDEFVLAAGRSPIQESLIPVAVEETLDERNRLMNKCELYDILSTPKQVSAADTPRCIGYGYQNNDDQCLENARKHNLYCEKHLPNFLKRARNGRSRLISKEVFITLLKNCSSRKQTIYLHRACELLYGFMKSNLSRQKSISKRDQMGWILSEASKDSSIGDYLLKLVSSERKKIGRLWGFDTGKDKQKPVSKMSLQPMVDALEKDHDSQMTMKCKICAEELSDDKSLSVHWMQIHKKEAQWLFRGYACAICMNSFTNRKVLETHVKEKHGEKFLEGSLLFRCMSCNNHFINPEQLWEHVLSSHSMDFRLPNLTQSDYLSVNNDAQLDIELCSKSSLDHGALEKEDGSQKFICKFCGLKFDLLPDLGRHHQAAHMNQNSTSLCPPRGTSHHLKRKRYRHPRFKKGLIGTHRFTNSSSFGMKKCFHSSSSVISARIRLQRQSSQTAGLGRLLESHCSDVAETLFAKIQQTKPRPSNLEILSIARSTCCRTSLCEVLREKYAILPECLYLKAAKLCSELNIQVNWHLEGFACPKGCKPSKQPYSSAPLTLLPNKLTGPAISSLDLVKNDEWERDEYHYILSSKHFNWKPIRKTITLCEDLSFGQESVPVACVVDEDIKNSLHTNTYETSFGQGLGISKPWQGFTYVTKRMLDPSLGLDTKSSQLRCACSDSKCRPGMCDHVYLFDNDYENAKDIHGESMRGRFPYDERGQIILEEGYLVYECNSMCSCDKICQNRVLQNGVQVKLEVFRTEKKGWAVRAGEAISRGSFVCEYIGEVLSDIEANKRGERYDNEGCSYLYDIDAHIDDVGHLSEGTVPYVIDATKYGNVSRFINHSCSPNLVNYQVLVESMDCQLAHVGLYASRDIELGEELAYDYRYKLLPGDGRLCYCGASNCRGRLY